MMNIRSYKKLVREMKVGESFYLNIINCSVAIAEYTKELIQTGIIVPTVDEVEKMIVPEAVGRFMSGECLCPQMTYTKVR